MWIYSPRTYVNVFQSRVDKRSASTVPPFGGCAALIHPTNTLPRREVDSDRIYVSLISIDSALKYYEYPFGLSLSKPSTVPFDKLRANGVAGGSITLVLSELCALCG